MGQGEAVVQEEYGKAHILEHVYGRHDIPSVHGCWTGLFAGIGCIYRGSLAGRH
jgi:hypothetical protein